MSVRRLELVVPDTGEIVDAPGFAREKLSALVAGARRALEHATSFVEVKDIRDKAEALRVYVRSINGSAEAQNRCAELKVRAEIRMGQELAKMEKHPAGRPSINNRSHDATDFLRIHDLGITKSDSSRWQQMASVPQDAVEGYFDSAKEITSVGVQKLARQQKRAMMMQTQSEAPQGRVENLTKLLERGDKFGTIYADPPWQYANQGTRAATDNHYRTMTTAEICALPIKSLAADDAHLHLWTTNGFLFDCPQIFEAWGFEYRSSFIWVKPQMGIGNYWRNSHEILLTAIRGDAKRFGDTSLRSWLECDRGAHSAKPEEIRSMIERASPGPRLELFSRKRVEGWVTWGDGVPDPDLLTRNIPEVT